MKNYDDAAHDAHNASTESGMGTAMEIKPKPSCGERIQQTALGLKNFLLAIERLYQQVSGK